MSTKVKGETIKEGSIPLSALSSDAKCVTGSYDVVIVFDAAGTYQFNFLNYYFSKVGNNFVPLLSIGDGKDILINSGPPVYIRYEYNGMYSTCVITDVAGYITKERPVEIVTINKSNSLFLPDDIGSADWNAVEGEAGHIKNKPFGDNIEGEPIQFSRYELGDYINIYDVCYEKFGDELYDMVYAACFYKDELDKFAINLPLKNADGLLVSNPPIVINMENIDGQEVFDYYDGERNIQVYLFYANDLDGDLYKCIVIPFWEGDISDIINNNFIEIKDRFIQTLNEKFIPDTVVKTTLQTLSDDAKNQALANLGIVPIVWKYLCNPFILQTGRQLPDELLTEDRQDFKYKIDGMYRWVKGFTVGTEHTFEFPNLGIDNAPTSSGIVIDMTGCGNELINDNISDTNYTRDDSEWEDYFTTGSWKIRNGKCYIAV